MAPYISSHLRDGVWMAPPCQVPSLDILQNLVANTRLNQSATPAKWPCQHPLGGPGGGWHPAATEDQRLEMAAIDGWLRLVPPWTPV